VVKGDILPGRVISSLKVLRGPVPSRKLSEIFWRHTECPGAA
jgi:hypothetical protein